jgi:hypothetical protein
MHVTYYCLQVYNVFFFIIFGGMFTCDMLYDMVNNYF